MPAERAWNVDLLCRIVIFAASWKIAQFTQKGQYPLHKTEAPQ